MFRRLSFAATGEGEASLGFARTREAPRSSGVGPAYSDSTSDYLASPPRAGASARAPSTFLCFDWRRGGVAKSLFEPERHLAQLALARLTLIRPATTFRPLLEKELALELPRLSFAATEGGK